MSLNYPDLPFWARAVGNRDQRQADDDRSDNGESPHQNHSAKVWPVWGRSPWRGSLLPLNRKPADLRFALGARVVQRAAESD
jgi:hypothetical protein